MTRDVITVVVVDTYVNRRKQIWLQLTYVLLRRVKL
jgi:hypothetical protein